MNAAIEPANRKTYRAPKRIRGDRIRNNRVRIRNGAIALGCLALAFYLGFIALLVLRSRH